MNIRKIFMFMPSNVLWVITSIFDAIVLDWWMFTKTDIFGIFI